MPRKTTPAARLKALIASLTADLSPDGAVLTEAELAFIRLASANMMRAEAIAEAVGRGETVDDGELVRLTNAASRIVRDLRDTKDRRAAVVAAKPGMSPLEQFAADLAARKAAEPVDEDDDAELPAAIAEFVAGKAGQVGKTVEPADIDVAESEPAPKPKPPLTVCFDPRPRGPGDPSGQTLLEVVAELPPNAIVTLSTPHFSRNDMTVEEVARETGAQAWWLKGDARLIGRKDWFVR